MASYIDTATRIVVDASPQYAGGFIVEEKKKRVYYYSLYWAHKVDFIKSRPNVLELLNATMAVWYFKEFNAITWPTILKTDNDAVKAAMENTISERNRWRNFKAILDVVLDNAMTFLVLTKMAYRRTDAEMSAANRLTGVENSFGATKAVKIRELEELFEDYDITDCTEHVDSFFCTRMQNIVSSVETSLIFGF